MPIDGDAVALFEWLTTMNGLQGARPIPTTILSDRHARRPVGARIESMIEQTPAILLARVQFAFTISFHFLLPAFSIGLASYLAVLEALWLRTGSGVYANLFRYWLKIFAIVFAMGVVSGKIGRAHV